MKLSLTAAIALTILALLGAVYAVKAEGHCIQWSKRTYCNPDQIFGLGPSCRTWRRCVRWASDGYERRYYAAPRRHYRDDRDDDDRVGYGRREQCLPETVDVLSTEHQSEDNAREAARKLVMAKIQWLYGSQYMDLANAADVRWRCSASNAHDTVSGRIAEAAGALTGRGGQNLRCALWVRPCRAPREKDRDSRR